MWLDVNEIHTGYLPLGTGSGKPLGMLDGENKRGGQILLPEGWHDSAMVRRQGSHRWSAASYVSPTREGAPNLGMCPDGNQTSNLLLSVTMPNELSHTGQGLFICFFNGCIILYNLSGRIICSLKFYFSCIIGYFCLLIWFSVFHVGGISQEILCWLNSKVATMMGG